MSFQKWELESTITKSYYTTNASISCASPVVRKISRENLRSEVSGPDGRVIWEQVTWSGFRRVQGARMRLAQTVTRWTEFGLGSPMWPQLHRVAPGAVTDDPPICRRFLQGNEGESTGKELGYFEIWMDWHRCWFLVFGRLLARGVRKRRSDNFPIIVIWFLGQRDIQHVQWSTVHGVH